MMGMYFNSLSLWRNMDDQLFSNYLLLEALPRSSI